MQALSLHGVGGRVRLEWLAQRVEPVLDLAGLFPDGIEGTGFGRRLTRAPKWDLSANAIAARSSHLRHAV